jgi:bifunctional DNase/RNase
MAEEEKRAERPDPSDAGEASSERVSVKLRGLAIDPSSKTPVVVLQEEHSGFFLPIWVGAAEANAIALRLGGIETPRPMTHDLMRTLLDELEGRLESIEISDLRDNTFYALLHLSLPDGAKRTVDCRPSDAIALALRAGAEILVQRNVLENAKAFDLASRIEDEDALKDWLEQIPAEDLGDYEM